MKPSAPASDADEDHNKLMADEIIARKDFEEKRLKMENARLALDMRRDER